MWICPNCRKPLTLQLSQWRCCNQHVFDMAKEGYVNLLLANKKSSLSPGDSKEMLTARRQFLDEGHYAKLSDTIAELVASCANQDGFRIHDAGCGEGYYLAQVANRLSTSEIDFSASGSDIAKFAIQKAAKKYPQCDFAVASSFDIPVAENSIDVALLIFAPANYGELGRILKPSGLWLQVIPGPKHLRELKDQVYESPMDHELASTDHQGFVLVDSLELDYQFELPNHKSAEQLLKMTPFYWSTKKEKLEQIVSQLDEVSADFRVLCWQRQP